MTETMILCLWWCLVIIGCLTMMIVTFCGIFIGLAIFSMMLNKLNRRVREIKENTEERPKVETDTKIPACYCEDKGWKNN